MTHTPGPWTVNGPWHIEAPYISQEHNLPRIVAQVVKGFYISDEEREANAALIAAAPALLEACKGMLEWARRVKHANSGPEIAQAQAAITQAAGSA